MLAVLLHLVALTPLVFAQDVGRRDVVFGKVVSVEGKTVIANVRDFVQMEPESMAMSPVQRDGNDVVGESEKRVRNVDTPGQKRVELPTEKFQFQIYGRSVAKKRGPVTLDVTQIKPGALMVILKNSEIGLSDFYRGYLRDDVLIVVEKQGFGRLSGDTDAATTAPQPKSPAPSRRND